MFAAGVITFREVLEASLVVGIILSYLRKTNQLRFSKFVWRGALAGVLFALLFALVINTFFAGLPRGRAEQIAEGVLMFLTAGLLTWMILWVHRQKEYATKIRKQVLVHIQRGFGMGIFFLSLTSVVREGIEATLYLKATSLAGSHNQFLGALFGILIAIFLGFLLFSYAVKIKLTTIFKVTTFCLLLFAAGLVSSGVHEFQEALLLPTFSFDPIFNITHIISNESIIGSILASLFGYTSKPTILELSSYALYVGCIFWLEKKTDTILAKPYSNKE